MRNPDYNWIYNNILCIKNILIDNDTITFYIERPLARGSNTFTLTSGGHYWNPSVLKKWVESIIND